jgi:hypothetical protein
VTFTAWDILPNSTGKEPPPPDFLPAVKAKTCTGDAQMPQTSSISHPNDILSGR